MRLAHSTPHWDVVGDGDLGRAHRVVERLTSSGRPYQQWVPCGMPRIPAKYIDLVFYLYDTVEAAERGDTQGGTGFFAWVPFANSSSHGFTYAVSNRHVVRTGSSVLRINCHDGGVDIWDVGPEAWMVHPDGDDLAILHCGLDAKKHKYSTLPTTSFVTTEGFAKGDYGLGDPAFMIGRFVAHDGRETNVPAVGFGNISIPPSLMKGNDGRDQLSFGVEMRAMRGNSGSPVFTYTEPWDMESNSVRVGGQRLRFLGVDWGQVVFPVEVREHIIAADPAALRPGEREAKFVRLNTGMNGVIPAWRLLELLNLPELVEARTEYERQWLLAHPPEPLAEPN